MTDGRFRNTELHPKTENPTDAEHGIRGIFCAAKHSGCCDLYDFTQFQASAPAVAMCRNAIYILLNIQGYHDQLFRNQTLKFCKILQKQFKIV